jgi:hypothetical protein
MDFSLGMASAANAGPLIKSAAMTPIVANFACFLICDNFICPPSFLAAIFSAVAI